MRAVPSSPPEGFRYLEEVVSPALEADIVRTAADFVTEPYVMRGQASRRRIAFFGVQYAAAGKYQLEPGPPLPPVLSLLRDLATRAAGLEPAPFIQALFSRYPPGAGIGWHRDFPVFGPIVLGVSLQAPCRLKLRERAQPRNGISIELAPRSLYVLAGAARSAWEHSIPALRAERCSVTFRSLVHPPAQAR